MAYRIEFDFAASTTLQEFLTHVVDAKIIDFQPIGPGGGNPRVLLQFAHKEALRVFIMVHDPAECELHLKRAYQVDTSFWTS